MGLEVGDEGGLEEPCRLVSAIRAIGSQIVWRVGRRLRTEQPFLSIQKILVNVFYSDVGVFPTTNGANK